MQKGHDIMCSYTPNTDIYITTYIPSDRSSKSVSL